MLNNSKKISFIVMLRRKRNRKEIVKKSRKRWVTDIFVKREIDG